jgi:ribonuclease R
VLEGLLLRSLKQATYDTTNIGHFGLASPAYLHFTSPIRRYPDLLVHRTVKHLLRGGRSDTSPAALQSLQDTAVQASGRERAVMQIEREVVDLYRAVVMKSHIGEQFEGTVTALVGSGGFVALDEPFVDVLVRYENFGPDQYNLDDTELMVVGRRSGDKVTVGDRMKVEITDVAVLRRSVYGARIVPHDAQTKGSQKAQFRPKGALHKLRVGKGPFARGDNRNERKGRPGQKRERNKRSRRSH